MYTVRERGQWWFWDWRTGKPSKTMVTIGKSPASTGNLLVDFPQSLLASSNLEGHSCQFLVSSLVPSIPNPTQTCDHASNRTNHQTNINANVEFIIPISFFELNPLKPSLWKKLAVFCVKCELWKIAESPYLVLHEVGCSLYNIHPTNMERGHLMELKLGPFLQPKCFAGNLCKQYCKRFRCFY